jgi:N-sulfoglucosamine sulfohydrolase
LRAFAHRPEWELYDLAADPDESKNLAGTPAAKPVFDDLRAQLAAFQKRTNDPFEHGISRAPD